MATDIVDTLQDVVSNAGYTATEHKLKDGPNVPDRLVAIVSDGGFDPQMHVGTNEPTNKRPEVRVLVRDAEDQKSRAWGDARDIWDLLHESSPSGIKLVSAIDPFPREEASDDDGRVIFSMTFELLVVE